MVNTWTCTGACISGLEYLHWVQQFALEPKMVDVMDNVRVRIPICTWIGENIDTVNAELNSYLQACHECFYSHERKQIQIFAVPLAEFLGIDGFCNILNDPITILIDVGRTAREDWLSIVVHEYAHAHLAEFGHNHNFAEVLSHLCLGLGLDLPNWEPDKEYELRCWPNCKLNVDPLGFWRGQ